MARARHWLDQYRIPCRPSSPPLEEKLLAELVVETEVETEVEIEAAGDVGGRLPLSSEKTVAAVFHLVEAHGRTPPSGMRRQLGDSVPPRSPGSPSRRRLGPLPDLPDLMDVPAASSARTVADLSTGVRAALMKQFTVLAPIRSAEDSGDGRSGAAEVLDTEGAAQLLRRAKLAAPVRSTSRSHLYEMEVPEEIRVALEDAELGEIYMSSDSDDDNGEMSRLMRSVSGLLLSRSRSRSLRSLLIYDAKPVMVSTPEPVAEAGMVAVCAKSVSVDVAGRVAEETTLVEDAYERHARTFALWRASVYWFRWVMAEREARVRRNKADLLAGVLQVIVARRALRAWRAVVEHRAQIAEAADAFAAPQEQALVVRAWRMWEREARARAGARKLNTALLRTKLSLGFAVWHWYTKATRAWRRRDGQVPEPATEIAPHVRELKVELEHELMRHKVVVEISLHARMPSLLRAWREAITNMRLERVAVLTYFGNLRGWTFKVWRNRATRARLVRADRAWRRKWERKKLVSKRLTDAAIAQRGEAIMQKRRREHDVAMDELQDQLEASMDQLQDVRRRAAQLSVALRDRARLRAARGRELDGWITEQAGMIEVPPS
ncbi:uncharacterized protein AMSG_08508 [Thecamonas trahens ATCC 50062]|uniref:Sfi1 spindle body domain-containing protein n=1 Tax=Thecamonas trahens ATCC 50062 TaxID=461836 RepID=A0A0L0DKB7_THETB|nr:hypothetical protein AMSG_08508 [Thecamonas trahens ATCC 50062]KNC52640.1 hypothetical protein AMSG_08508 [Thecamonas trahens ATCC 50062]|eukprot:XP_013755192.1 hypothetical protein AMSG_08508 [Thecamonas trahens ATCC 50062]